MKWLWRTFAFELIGEELIYVEVRVYSCELGENY